jgi:hypothetical protein
MCDCIKNIDEKLAENGQFLNCTMAFRTGEIGRPMIDIMRRDTWRPERRRGKPGFFVASYCPFCGENYSEKPAEDGSHSPRASDGEGKSEGLMPTEPNTSSAQPSGEPA